jgi:hypothetical protein
MTSPTITSEREYQVITSPDLRHRRIIKYAAIFILSIATAFILQPRMGVRDVDAYSYIVGAYSIQEGRGYNDLNGGSLSHWPPGYSLTLSLFPAPLQGALFINYLSLGVAILLIYHLARKSDKWAELPALGLALALGFIFLRRMATNASPDVATYALFLLALLSYNKDGFRYRAISYLIWGLLIPVKLIAVIFIPAAVLARYLRKPVSFIWSERYEILIAVTSWLLFLFITLNYSSQSSQPTIVHSHSQFGFNYNASYFMGAASYFTWSIVRNFLSNWYGSIWTIHTLIPYCVVLLVGLVCLFTLRFNSSHMAKHAVILILISCLLQFGSQHIDGARLTGYGFITLLFALHPAIRWGKIWFMYGLLGLSLSITNALTQNCVGANDPRYEKLAYEASKIENFPGKVLTNSFHILDIHARVPSEYVGSAGQISDAEYFFWVYLPSYDAIATTVSPTDMPREGWCEVASVSGAKLFRRCP